jgi:hypothetical protein
LVAEVLGGEPGTAERRNICANAEVISPYWWINPVEKPGSIVAYRKLPQDLEIFFPKASYPMMFFLIQYVADDRVDSASGMREGPIPILPLEAAANQPLTVDKTG